MTLIHYPTTGYNVNLVLRYTLSVLHADQWNVQPTLKRLNESLIDRGYVTWFDLTNMKGDH